MIAAGFSPDFIRWGCTIKDYKAFLLAAIQDRMERQREFSMAVSMAVASLFDPKVGKDASTAIQKAIDALVNQQEGLYGLQEFVEQKTGQSPRRAVTREQHKAAQNKRDESGLTNKEVKTWRDAGKIDLLMAKMTGRPTGALWSNVTDGTLQMDGNALSSMVESQTGAQIVSKMQNLHQRMRGSVRAGPRARPGKK